MYSVSAERDKHIHNGHKLLTLGFWSHNQWKYFELIRLLAHISLCASVSVCIIKHSLCIGTFPLATANTGLFCSWILLRSTICSLIPLSDFTSFLPLFFSVLFFLITPNLPSYAHSTGKYEFPFYRLSVCLPLWT